MQTAAAATQLERGSCKSQDVRQGLSRVALERALIIGVETDFLFPVEQQEELAIGLKEYVGDVAFRRMDSRQGHDAFLVDMDRFRPAIASQF